MNDYFIDTANPVAPIAAGELQSQFRNVLGITGLDDAALATYGRAHLTVHPAPAFDSAAQVPEDPVIGQDPDGTWHMRTPVRDKTQAELDADTAAAAAAVIAAIREHAEDLIRAGVILEGAAFKGDETSLARLERSSKMLRGGMIAEARFMTAAGVPYTVTDPDILDNLWAAIVQYGAQVLAASTDLQLAPPASAADVPGNAAWPARPDLTIAELTPVA